MKNIGAHEGNVDPGLVGRVNWRVLWKRENFFFFGLFLEYLKERGKFKFEVATLGAPDEDEALA